METNLVSATIGFLIYTFIMFFILFAISMLGDDKCRGDNITVEECTKKFKRRMNIKIGTVALFLIIILCLCGYNLHKTNFFGFLGGIFVSNIFLLSKIIRGYIT